MSKIPETGHPRSHLPVPGQRILRSMLAAWLCLAIYYVRGQRGLPFFSIIAALQCIQPYTENMLSVGRKRIVGTLVGALWGSAILYMEYLTVGSSGPGHMLRFLLMGACAGAVIYSTVLLKIPETAYFSAVVFLSIAMNHTGDSDTVIYIIDRTLDTAIGVAAGIFINSLHLPRIRHPELLFVSGIEPVLSGMEHHMSPYTKVELNRLIRDGAKFTVVTMQTPAVIREMLEGIRLEYPVIAMDGAVMYDIEKRFYLAAETMDAQMGKNLEQFFREHGTGYFMNIIEDNLLTTVYRKMQPGSMKHLFSRRSGSPYRNFVHTEREITEDIVNFVVVGEIDSVQALCSKLKMTPFSGRLRTQYDSYGCAPGEIILRVYSADATRERMIARLKESLQAERVIKFGKPEADVDEVLPYTGDRMVKELKRRFEAVDLRGWRNILRP